MAEFCLDCMNKMDDTHYTEADVIVEEGLCEGCGEIVPCVIAFRYGLRKVLWELFHLFRKS